ncbi:acetyltransferase [Aerococcus urinaeequi]|uniref:acetyltransferase n=1 Tax=Aerococcus urinaeequi TaxID=51665 RepID=UPI003EDA63DE
MKDIVIIGAGGYGREVTWLLEDINKENPQWNILGFIDDNESIQGKQLGEYKVIGTTDYLFEKELTVVIAIANPFIRREVYNKLKDTKNIFPTLIHPSVIYSDSVTFGQGVIVSAGSIVTIDITIEDFVIIDRGCNIGHDTKISKFSTLLPSTTVSGNVHIEENLLIGTGSTIIQGLTIGKKSIVGAGAVVTKNIPKNCTAVGVPAKPIKFHENT